MTNHLRTFLFRLLFWTLSIPVVGLAPIWAVMGEGTVHRVAHFWARSQGRLARAVLGIDVRVEGELIDGPAIYAAKHQAMFETLDLVHRIDRPVIVIKKELVRIPMWGWLARRYGAMAVDREASAAALRAMLQQAKAVRESGRPVMIFPEGTRVKPGETPPLKSGFAGLYKALGLPVVPVALDTGRLLPRGGPFRPGTVTLRFGEPIPPGLPRKEIEARVHAAINALEAPQP